MARAHRGRRLGLLVKLAMLEWLAEAEPERRWILTGNAETNEHMIAINEAFGYQRFAHPVVSLEIPAEKVLQATSYPPTGARRTISLAWSGPEIRAGFHVSEPGVGPPN